MASPKDVLTWLQIVELSSKSPAYAHITSAAHAALTSAQMVALATAAEEAAENPPSKKGK